MTMVVWRGCFWYQHWKRRGFLRGQRVEHLWTHCFGRLQQWYSSCMERVVCTCSCRSKETPQIWRAHRLLHFVVTTEFVSQISPDAEYSVVGDVQSKVEQRVYQFPLASVGMNNHTCWLCLAVPEVSFLIWQAGNDSEFDRLVMLGPFKTIQSRGRNDAGTDLPRHLLGNESLKTAFILNMSLRKMVAGLARLTASSSTTCSHASLIACPISLLKTSTISSLCLWASKSGK